MILGSHLVPFLGGGGPGPPGASNQFKAEVLNWRLPAFPSAPLCCFPDRIPIRGATQKSQRKSREAPVQHFSFELVAPGSPLWLCFASLIGFLLGELHRRGILSGIL